MMIRYSIFLFIIFSVAACTDGDDGKSVPVFRQQEEIAQVKVEKPVKIKLKKNVSGKYSWEISGDKTEKVIEADKKLRTGLGK